jgi:hypothetical protein
MQLSEGRCWDKSRQDLAAYAAARPRVLLVQFEEVVVLRPQCIWSAWLSWH